VTPTPEANRRERERRRKHVKIEEMDLEEQLRYEEDREEPYVEHYTRAAAEYVAPLYEATTPDQFALGLAFAAEHYVAETDLFSAYAFGGLRQQPPYRMLHEIDQPNEADISGWAEDSRWSFEQRACFWHTMPTTGWNESPAHMAFVAEKRQR
jgi:hypothetical protein